MFSRVIPSGLPGGALPTLKTGNGESRSWVQIPPHPLGFRSENAACLPGRSPDSRTTEPTPDAFGLSLAESYLRSSATSDSKSSPCTLMQMILPSFPIRKLPGIAVMPQVTAIGVSHPLPSNDWGHGSLLSLRN